MVCLLWALAVFAFVVWTFYVVLVWRVASVVEIIEPTETSTSLPALTVVIPARNEEKTLEQGLRSVLAQQGVDFRVVLVNDHSTDRTGAIADALAAEDSRLRVLHNPDLPPGWLGKCNALHQGAAGVESEFVLFTDADIVHKPGCFAAALGRMERDRLDFLTLLPQLVCVEFWEHMLVPLFFLAIPLLAPVVSVWGREKPTTGSGAFLLLRTRVYRALGGHEQLRMSVVDDMELAGLVKRSGYSTGVLMGTRLLDCRMYHGNREAFWGFTKNVLHATPGKPHLAVLGLPGMIALLWSSPILMAGGIIKGQAWVALTGGILYLYQYASLFLMRRFARLKGWNRVLLFPMVSVSLACCIIRAAYHHWRHGQVVWRGRGVSLTSDAEAGKKKP
ncbi:MAG TPA: glycosyltransferase family 2 protein [Candidatus Sumerlaeota bacterium]|nr:glycosyltransferase family 2 protein [Candidatus Sumerlaeota bacterium]HPS00304.1 glycosyltransferase family 2 protein [Candidatus Sumerlaeota bacterium]